MAEAAAVDYWDVLGLDPGADATTLKRAFREQARRWHPDLNGDDPRAEERFKLVNEAYAVLSDPRRRASWEAGEEIAVDRAGGDGLIPFAVGFPAFEEYLQELFGVGAGEPSEATGERWEGEAEPEEEFEPEPATGPFAQSGDVTASPSPPPPVQAAVDAETPVDLDPQQALHGTRLELELQDGSAVEVWTPPLAGDGWRLRLAGVAPGGADHFLHLRVRTPEGLRVDGLRVLYTLELAPAEAVLGCHATVPTLAGPVRLRVPPGSSSGRLLRLRGRGLRRGEDRGDQLVELRIMVPDHPTEAEEALYRRLLELAREEEEALG
jgi:DnaJ-class molecular chaperone